MWVICQTLNKICNSSFLFFCPAYLFIQSNLHFYYFLFWVAKGFVSVSKVTSFRLFYAFKQRATATATATLPFKFDGVGLSLSLSLSPSLSSSLVVMLPVCIARRLNVSVNPSCLYAMVARGAGVIFNHRRNDADKHTYTHHTK